MIPAPNEGAVVLMGCHHRLFGGLPGERGALLPHKYKLPHVLARFGDGWPRVGQERSRFQGIMSLHISLKVTGDVTPACSHPDYRDGSASCRGPSHLSSRPMVGLSESASDEALKTFTNVHYRGTANETAHNALESPTMRSQWPPCTKWRHRSTWRLPPP